MRVRSILAFLGALALAGSAAAQTKMSGTATCKPDPSTPIAVGDTPGHSLSAAKAQCTWARLEMAGVAAKEGVSVSTAETRGDATTSRGYHTGTMANGDTWSCSFEGKSMAKDGKPVSDSGAWSFISGTGKLQGLQGKGTYKGTPNADGTMTYQIEGEYSVK